MPYPSAGSPKCRFSIEVSFEHCSPFDDQSKDFTYDTWYGNAIFIEKMARLLKVYQAIAPEHLSNFTIIESEFRQTAIQYSIADSEIEMFFDAIPRNIFDSSTRAQVSNYAIYWYNHNSERHYVEMSD